MGGKISIDKHVSNLEEILEMNPKSFSKLKFENKIPDSITQHIKIWRFYEDSPKGRGIKSAPISLQTIQSSEFSFVSTECYLVLLVYKKSHADYSQFLAFPHSMWGVVESYSNLTPRGLEVPVSTSETLENFSKEILDSFLMPQRTDSQSEDSKFEYMIFVWNGKTANPLVKSIALSNAFELENLINKGKDPFLQVLFAGGVIRNKKLQKGSIIQLNSSQNKTPSKEYEKEIKDMRETIFLFKFLLPPTPNQEGGEKKEEQDSKSQGKRFPKINKLLNKGTPHLSKEIYQSKFIKVSGCSGGNHTDNNTKPRPATNEDLANNDLASTATTTKKGVKIPSLALHKTNGLANSPQNHAEQNKVQQEISKATFQQPTVVAASKLNKFNIPQLNLAMRNDTGPQAEMSRQGQGNIGYPADKDLVELELEVDDEQFIEENKLERNNYFPEKRHNEMDDENFDEDNYFEDNKRVEDRFVEEGENQEEDWNDIEELEQREHSRGELNQRQGNLKSALRSEEEKNSFKNIGLDNLKKNENFGIEDLVQEEEDGFDFDIRDTTRKQAKVKHYGNLCSEVIKDFLYVGGEPVAYNKKLLQETGITDIINCAADVCENRFPETFNYKKYHLKDSKQEGIECLFYDTIMYMDEVREKGGRVLVHCVQGVSRSVTICLAYMIFKSCMTYDEAFNSIRRTRKIASPNMGFIVQLIFFYKRLFKPQEILHNPKIFCISSHELESPQLIVARYLMEPLYSNRNFKALDPRGIFIIQSSKLFYIWVGNECYSPRKERYVEYAYYYLDILRNFERGPEELFWVEAGGESIDFWKNWGFSERLPDVKYLRNKDWDNWFIDLNFKAEPRFEKNEENETEDPCYARNQPKTNSKAVLFIFPNFEEAIYLYDLEDLHEEDLCVFCQKFDESTYNKKVFVWRGANFSDHEAEAKFIESVIKAYYGEARSSRIEIVPEEANNESEEFLDCF